MKLYHFIFKNKTMSSFYIENGNLWACGANSFGELGLGDNDNRSIFTKVPLDFDVTEVFSCYPRTIIKDDDDNLWISGANPANKNNLYECSTNVFVKIPTKFKIKKISCIRQHIMAIDHNGNLWGYGRNYEGQLGLGDFDYRESFEKIPLNSLLVMYHVVLNMQLLKMINGIFGYVVQIIMVNCV